MITILTFSIGGYFLISSIFQVSLDREINAAQEDNQTLRNYFQAVVSAVSKLKKNNQNDYKGFIEKTSCIADGEVAEKTVYGMNPDLILKEEAFDGFYTIT